MAPPTIGAAQNSQSSLTGQLGPPNEPEITAVAVERDVRGFALKFFTDEGNWDLVGHNSQKS